MPRRLLLLPFLLLPACGKGGQGPVADACRAETLPLVGSGAAPTVADVALEVHDYGIVLLATATDPQGSANLLNVQQRIGIFPDSACAGAVITLQDDLSGSGLEESFGTALTPAQNASLYHAIASSRRWPVQVDFADREEHTTRGRVMARVILQ